jgi:hypothetical protein
MTKEDQDQGPKFKVVDRRGVTDEGTEVAGKGSQNTEPKKPLESAEPKTRPPVSFLLFVQSLAHQAMMALGMVPWPDSGLIKVELTLAKETIDILQMLKEKTLGNLSQEETVLLDSLLYQLKIAFVELSKNPQGPTSSFIK